MADFPFSKALMLTTRAYLASERAARTMEHLRHMDIPFAPFVGFDWKETGVLTINPFEFDYPGSGSNIGIRKTSMNLSHMALWRACEHIPGDTFLLLEDDVRFDADWRTHWDAVAPFIPSSWDMIYLGSCCCSGRPTQHIAGRLYKVGYALCLHAYVLKRKALSVIIDACSKVYAPTDINVCLNAIPKLETYAVLPRIALQENMNLLP